MGDWGTTSISVFGSLVMALAASGVDVRDLLAEADVTPDALRDPERRVPTDVTFRVFADAPRLSGDPHFGLHTGARAPMGSFLVLDHATRSSRTIGEALARTVRYYALLVERIELKIEAIGGVARVLHRAPPPIVSPRPAIEMLFAIMVARGSALTGTPWPMRCVRFVHARPEDADEDARFFRAPVEYGQPLDELVFDRAFLDAPLATADPALSALLDRFADTLIAKLPPGDPFVPAVRRAITESLRGSDPSLEATARRMAVSTRTLQRKLHAIGTSHQELVDEVRRELARQYLTDPSIAIGEVGYLLGFSQSSAFHRAFKRWTGQSPKDYRAASLRRR